MNRGVVHQLENDINSVLALQPGLQAVYTNKQPTQLEGTYRLLDDLGLLQQEYLIKVTVPPTYPSGFPRLYERGNSIERILDRHMLKDGECCVENYRIRTLIGRRGISLLDFFLKYVHRFFCWQLVFDIEGPKNLDGWGHGAEGIIEYYQGELGTTDMHLIGKILHHMDTNTLPGVNDPCLCGSEKKSKICHGPVIQQLWLLGPDTIKIDAFMLAKINEA